jgi:hypothetical protein
MKLLDLILKGYNGKLVPLPDPNPLTTQGDSASGEDTALVESTLVSFAHFVLPSAVALLFDLRTALAFRVEENTGLIVLRGISNISLTRDTNRKVWLVYQTKFIKRRQDIQLLVSDIMKPWDIKIQAQSAEFMTGIVPRIGEVAAEASPENRNNYLSTLPNWDMDMDVLSWSSTL